MRSKLIWIIGADHPHNPTEAEFNAFVEADLKVNGWRVKPTLKSALRLAQKLADECSYPMEVFWKQGNRVWKYGLLVEPK